MLHELQLKQKYCDFVCYGAKTFEVRLNDRNFQVSDLVHFVAVDSLGFPIEHKINGYLYCITYVLSDFCGLAENYFAFGISFLDCIYECKSYEQTGFLACHNCKG